MVSSVKTSATSLKASQQGLGMVEQARIRKGWKRQSLVWADTALTSVPTLKRFLKGEPIQEDTFVRICRAVGVDWQKVVDDTAHPCLSPPDVTRDWGEAPDIWAFYGRNQELSILEQWIVEDHCRVVALVGMAGIGKTALAAKLAEQIHGEFEYFIWCSLHHAPPITALLASLISFFSEQHTTETDLSKIVDFMRQHRCLLVLDELDAILGSRDFEDYLELITRVGKARDLQSCILLTSQEKPKEIVLLEGDRLPVRSLVLAGLGDAAYKLFNDEGLTYKLRDAQTLIQTYRGNPLALKIVSVTIKELFASNMSEFLKQSTVVIYEVFRDSLERCFERLSELEKIILYELAMHQQPNSISHMSENISPSISNSGIITALESLRRRCLIEKITQNNQVFFTLQPVVVNYIKSVLDR